MMLERIGLLLLSYVIGSIPTGYVLARWLKGIDIREHGSGSTGATNVKRVVGTKAGIATLVLDFLKGLLPVLAVMYWLVPASQDPDRLIALGVGIGLVIGHSKSLFLKFQGGKSVITSLGVFMALHTLPSLLTALIAVTIIKLTRTVSVGSMAGAVLMPIFIVWLDDGPMSHVILTCLMACYVIYLHRSNIVRLLKHQENKL